MKKLNLAIIGQGRSGKDIHGTYYLSAYNVYYNVKYIVEADEVRRDISLARYEGCKVVADYKELFAHRDEIDVVVNASYSEMHYAITKDLLEHGFNVLVEKPFCRNQFEADDLILTAERNNVKLAVFHQSLFSPFLVKAKEVIASGIIGKVEQISIRYNGFSRRWDWQTLQKRMGGNAYNTGPHPIGVALALIDFDKNYRVVYSRTDSTELCSGDADDFVKIIIDTPEKPIVDIEINSTDAYSGYNVKLQGTRGTFKTSTLDYEMKYIVEGENQPREAIFESLMDDKRNPIYCSEQLIKHEETGKYDGTPFDYGTKNLYEELYYYITENRPMKYTAVEGREIVGVIADVHANNKLKMKY